jgi:uncharacterized protein
MDSRRAIVGGLGVLFLSFGVFIHSAQALTVPPNDGFVTDLAKILTPDQERAIETELTGYRNATSNEVAVLIVKALDGVPIESLGIETLRKWGIGTKKDNGILLLIAYDDHTARIEVGNGLEGVIPDIVAKGIIDTDIVPRFRQGEYFGGIQAAITSMEKHIGGEFTPDRYAGSQSDGVVPFLVFFGFIVFQSLLAIMARSKSWWLGGVLGGIAGLILALLYSWWLSIPVLVVIGLLLDYVVSKVGPQMGRRRRSVWWLGGGGFGGGSGGGGFSGFGGGTGSGGGATGRW